MTNTDFIELYSDSKYEKPSVTIDIVLFRINERASQNYRKLGEKVLQVWLKKRDYNPFLGHFSIPGTFIDLSHELTDTVKKCALNKIGAFPYYYEQLFTFGRLNRDPRTRVISVCYLLLTNSIQNFEGGEWFDIEIENQEAEKEILEDGYHLVQNIFLKLKNDNHQLVNKFEVTIDKKNLQETKTINILENSLAFDHAEFIYHALERLKNKIEYTDIVFNLLPTTFTLTELKNCYEIILGEKLLDANFRRKISKLVVRTDNFAERKGHRVSQLYTFNPTWRSYTLD